MKIAILQNNKVEGIVEDIEKNYGLKSNIKFTYEAQDNNYSMEITETDIAQTITFCGLSIDIKTLDIIPTGNLLASPIRFSNFASFISSVLGISVDRDSLLFAIEAYKLNSKFDMFCKSIFANSSGTGSFIGQYINRSMDISSDSSKVRFKLLKAISSLEEKINNMGREMSYSNTYVVKMYPTALYKVDPVYPNDNDEKLYAKSVLGFWSEKVTDYKCANVLELTKFIKDGDDIIFSSDPKKALTAVGIDKLLTSRELTSIANTVKTNAMDFIAHTGQAALIPGEEPGKGYIPKVYVEHEVMRSSALAFYDLLVKLSRAYKGGDI